jgi:hypothetical protein
MIKLDFIITGTGRCGTLYWSNLFTSLGIPCSHEGVFTHQGLNCALRTISGEERLKNSMISEEEKIQCDESNIRAESSYMAAPFTKYFPHSSIIHVIRNPIKVVSSFISMGFFSKEITPESNPYEYFMHEHIPELKEDIPPLDKACLYWAEWNNLIEYSGRVAYRQKIEDYKDGLVHFLGANKIFNLPKVCNASKHLTFNWSTSDIQNPKIKKILKDVASRHGYVKLLTFLCFCQSAFSNMLFSSLY